MLDPGADISDVQKSLQANRRRLRLIGEHPLTEIDRELLRLLIKMEHREHPGSRGVDRLWSRYPDVLAAALVEEGVHGYQAGDYWTAIQARLGLSHPHETSCCGRRFRGFLERVGLPTFAHLEGHRNLVPILAHGGIPDYCLEDYFEVLLKAWRDPELRDLSSTELIEEWRTRSSAFVLIDRPVERFLLHGGQVAADFLGRSLDLLRVAVEDGEVMDAETAGLPARVVLHFREWFAQTGRSASPRGAAGPRIPPPAAYLDPWGIGVVLRLPAVPIPDGMPAAEWLVDGDGEVHAFRAPRSLVARESEALEVPMPLVAQVYAVTLRLGSRSERTWRVRGVTPDRPYLAFDGNTGRALSFADVLPAKLVWLVATPDPAIADPRVTEVLPPPTGAFRAFQAVALDLSDGRPLVFGDRVVPVESAGCAIEVESPTPFDGEDSALAAPWIPGTPPILRVRVPPGADPATMRVTVRALGPVSGPALREGLLAGLGAPGAGGTPAADEWRLDLAHASLLGPHARGRFQVVVRGLLGSDARLELRIGPSLALVRRRGLGPRGRSGLALATTRDVRIHGITGVDDPADPATRLFPIETEVGHHLDLDLRVTTPDGPIAMPLRLASPVPRFGVVLGASMIRGWEPGPVSIELPAFLADVAPRLLLDGLVRPPAPVRLELRKGDGEVLQVLPVQRAKDRPRRGAAELALIRDTVTRHSGQRLVLALCQEPEGQPISSDAARFVAGQSVAAVRIESVESDQDEWCVTVAWRAVADGDEIEARIHALARPWHRPWTHAVARPSDGRTVLRIPRAQAPGGPCRLRIAAIDPWSVEDDDVDVPGRDRDDVAELALDGESTSTDEPTTGADVIERYLVASLTGGHDRTLLYPLRETFSAADVPAAVAALRLSARPDSGLPDAARGELSEYLRETLVEHVDALLAHLAPAAGRLRGDERDAMRRLLLGTDVLLRFGPAQVEATLARLDAANRDALAALYPPLAVALETAALVSGATDSFRRLATVLGEAELLAFLPIRRGCSASLGPVTGHVDALQPILDGETLEFDLELDFPSGPDRARSEGDETDTDPADGRSHALVDVSGRAENLDLRITPAWPEQRAVGRPLQSAELVAPRELLDEMLKCLNPVPQGLLSEDDRALALHEWLSRRARPGEPGDGEARTLRRHSALDQALRRVEQDGLVPRRVVRLVRGLWDEREGSTLGRATPFCAMAVAVLMRAVARGVVSTSLHPLSRADLTALALDLFEAAPRLFARSLCVAELLLAFDRSTA